MLELDGLGSVTWAVTSPLCASVSHLQKRVMTLAPPLDFHED